MTTEKLIYYYKLHPCFKCGDMATWWYMPGKGEPDDYYCDACVKRGCSCMIIESSDEDVSIPSGYHLNEDGNYECYDEITGQRLPCCEYGYYEEGIEKE